VEYSELSKVPPVPEKWPPQAQNYFLLASRELLSKNLLFSTDLPALKRYCFACYQADLAEEKLLDDDFVTEHTNKAKETNTVPSAWLRVLKDANAIIDKFGAKFGFSPVDKMKIAIPEKPKTNPLDEI
jgi:P27 family predicted phage terminase small subunit